MQARRKAYIRAVGVWFDRRSLKRTDEVDFWMQYYPKTSASHRGLDRSLVALWFEDVAFARDACVRFDMNVEDDSCIRLSSVGRVKESVKFVVIAIELCTEPVHHDSLGACAARVRKR